MRFLILLVSYGLVFISTSQNTKAQSFAERFHIGLYGGVNSSLAMPLTKHSVVTGNVEPPEKEYDAFYKNLGMQIGFLARFDIIPAICISIEPGYAKYVYGYGNRYQWLGEETILYEMAYKHKVQFLDIPAFIEFKKPGKLQPYVKGGGYVGIMLGAGTEVIMNQSNVQLGQPQSNAENKNVSSASAFVPLQYGVAAGGGIRYAIGSTMIGLDLTYKFPISKLSNTTSRFANNQLSGGFYDIADDILLHNIGLNIQIIVPFFKSGGGYGGSKGRGRRGTIPCPSEL